MFLEQLFGLKGKVALVIGGGGVLAGAMAEGLAKAGADVAIFDLNYQNAEKQAEKLKQFGVKALAIGGDATSATDLRAALTQNLKTFGQVDILINAPGLNSATPVFEITEQEWHKLLDVNLKSMFLACQIVGKQMIDQGRGGSIINISSASSGPPLSKVFTYSISKAGVNNLTQFLAREWAPYRVRVNAIAPGFFPAEQNRKLLTKERTEAIFRHTPMNRFGEPEELVGATIWLASEKASSFVTGAIIRVDGGFTAMTI
ncbi:MAG: SDR family oxidoreductase [candidate division KSB1 bacterium]|nr:SDR family oxidoreductase [candidate division KSB1 bacterium]